MTNVAHTVIARQDVGDVDGIVALFAEDCTFMMPILPAPLEGRDALRENVEAWPKAVTETEWVAIEGNRLVCAWNWRGAGWPDGIPLLRGVSTFIFNEDGLIQEYEDFFDPDWVTRKSDGLNRLLTQQ
jgi:ketosteroid isomerase-like protein